MLSAGFVASLSVKPSIADETRDNNERILTAETVETSTYLVRSG